MKRLTISLIALGIFGLAGCVVAPYGYYRPYSGPRVAVVAPVPAPVVVVR